MGFGLTFRHEHRYDTREPGITIPVVLSRGDRSLEVPAKIDTGASACIFQHWIGAVLGVSVESGELAEFATGGGSFRAYGHEVVLKTTGFEAAVLVYFAANREYPRNLLGRQGWLDRMRIGLVDYDGILYLSGYDDFDEP